MEQQRIYTVQELAQELRFSTDIIRRLVRDDPETIKLQGSGIVTGTTKRAYTSYRIPQSVVDRIRQKLTGPQVRPIFNGKVVRKIRKLDTTTKKKTVGTSLRSRVMLAEAS